MQAVERYKRHYIKKKKLLSTFKDAAGLRNGLADFSHNYHRWQEIATSGEVKRKPSNNFREKNK